MKLKVHKALAKRIEITKRGKVLKRKSGQGHFNSRESGNITRNKRRDISLNDTNIKVIKAEIPGV